MKNFLLNNPEIFTELLVHIIDTLNDRYEPDQKIDLCDDLHFAAFNEDYYIIGYYNANKWLGNNALTAIGMIQDYEMQNYGEIYTNLGNSESVVNMFTYLLGEYIIYNFLGESMTVKEMIETLEEEL